MNFLTTPAYLSGYRALQIYPAKGHKLEGGLSAIDQVCGLADDSSTGLTGSEGDVAPCGR